MTLLTSTAPARCRTARRAGSRARSFAAHQVEQDLHARVQISAAALEFVDARGQRRIVRRLARRRLAHDRRACLVAARADALGGLDALDGPVCERTAVV